MKILTQTSVRRINISVLLLRLIVGVILFTVGSGKVLRWFDGSGLEPTVQAFSNFGISAPFVYLSAFTEFIGGLFLILGFLTRFVAVAVIINMLVAVVLSVPLGFFLGVAFPLSLLVSALAIFLTGPMTYSIDYLIQPHDSIREHRRRTDRRMLD